MNGFTKQIKAIQTTYHGYKFRSRLEARWYIFFEHLKIGCEYEAEGYEIPNIAYKQIVKFRNAVHFKMGEKPPKKFKWLPDFWLPGKDILVEIKPISFLEESGCACRCNISAKFAALLKKDVLLIVGTVSPSEYFIRWFPAGTGIAEGGNFEWGVCSRCLHGVWLVSSWGEASELTSCGCMSNADTIKKYSLPPSAIRSNRISLPDANDGDILLALCAAKSARFEHGEKG